MAFAALFQPQSARVRAPGRDDGWWNPWEMTQKSMVRCQISAKLPEFPQTFKWAIHLKSRVNGGILKTVATYDYWCVNNFTNSAEYLAPRTLARAPWRWSLRLWTFEAGGFWHDDPLQDQKVDTTWEMSKSKWVYNSVFVPYILTMSLNEVTREDKSKTILCSWCSVKWAAD